MKVLLNNYNRRVVEDILDLASARLGLTSEDVKVIGMNTVVNGIDVECCIEMNTFSKDNLKEILEKVKGYNGTLKYIIIGGNDTKGGI